MSDNPAPILQPTRKPTLGDRIRDIATQLRQESDVQIKATSRILGAAAQIAQNHDNLIDEVVEMVEEDLEQQAQPAVLYTPETLQQQFKNLKDAKAHFGVKASGWAALADKLNQQPASATSSASQVQEPVLHRSSPIEQAVNSASPASGSQDPVLHRLETIEQEVQAMRGDINQILTLLNRVLNKLG